MWISRLLNNSRLSVSLAVFILIFLSSPSIKSGLVLDDYLFAYQAQEQSRAEQSRAEQSRAEQSRAEQSRAEQSRTEQSRAEQSRAEQSRDVSYDLFNFDRIFSEHLRPWFANETLKMTFFRPLSGLLFVMDYTLFGDNYWAWHLHSILWGVLFLVGAWRLFHLTLPKEVANLAILILSCSFFISWSIAWLSQRNHIAALTPGVWALYWYIKWRTEAWKPGYPLSIAGVSLGLLAAEYGLCILGFFLAFEASKSRLKVVALLSRLWPFGVVLVAYLILYKMSGAGAHGIPDYINPVSEPLRYLAVLPERLLTFVGFLFAQPIALPADSLLNRVFSMAFGLLGLVTLWIIAVRQNRDGDGNVSSVHVNPIHWYLAGTLLSFLPVASAPAEQRIMSCAALGFAALTAVMVFSCLGGKVLAKRPWWLKIYPVYLLLFCFLLSPGAYLSTVMWYKAFGKASEQSFQASMENIDPEKIKNIVLVRAPTSYPYMQFPTIAAMRGIESMDYWVLTKTTKPFSIKVIDAHTIEVSIQKTLLGDEDRGFRQPLRVPPLQEGEQVETKLFSVKFAETDDKTVVRSTFVFNAPLDDAGIQFMNWENGRLLPLALPGPGEAPIVIESYELGMFGKYL